VPSYTRRTGTNFIFLFRAISELIGRFIEDAKLNGFPRMLNEESNNLHNSSADLFIFYKNCMTQCMQLFTNSNLLCKLTVIFQKYLREYSHRVLSSSLPKLVTISGSTYSSISGAATSLIQNFQIQNMLKENSSQSSSGSGGGGLIGGVSGVSGALTSFDSSKKLNEAEICKICSILCTAEYCLETTQQLEDKLKEKVSHSNASSTNEKLDKKQIELNAKKINLSGEKDVFSNVISNCIQLLVQDLENSCEPALTAMAKVIFFLLLRLCNL
jgi:vacuolar protein sorting-associated protein 53